MSVYPDLYRYGYIIEQELGRNREGGRITWKAVSVETQQTVVIKQFCFAQANSSWSGYKAHRQEIEVLQQLDHPYIPQYLASLETDNGFYLIQKYIAASDGTHYRQLSWDKVKQIALNVLDILIYLQQQTPPILHHDIKPENILLDEALHAYLIDFGFSRLENYELAGSSLFKGTPGFIAPEQILKPTLASDIYSLGVTLVYLLTNKDLADISATASTDDPYQLNLDLLLPDIAPQFLGWLKKMTNAKLSQRFPDALSAKQALIELDSPLELADKATIDIFNQVKSLGGHQRDAGSRLRPLNSLTESKVMVGSLGISGLSIITVASVNFALSHIEFSLINIAIAVLAAAAIGITQLGAATIASWDHQARWQGFALSIIIPVILVTFGGLIWGRSEAVLIATAICVTQIMVLSYCWWQIFNPNIGGLIKAGSLLGIISLGITVGLQLI